MDQKRELLNGGYEMIENLPADSCFIAIPEPDPFKYKALIVEFLSVCGDDEFIITLQLDNLLVKWLKIKNFINLPQRHKILAILFLQPFWKNDYLSVLLEQPSKSDRSYIIYSPPITYGSSSGVLVCMGSVHPGQTRNVDSRFPFAFVELYYKAEHRFDIDCCTEADFEQCCRERTVKFMRTSKEGIYLLIFSQILKDEADCAKLLRKYLKNPTHSVWMDPMVGNFSFKTAAIPGLLYTTFEIQFPFFEYPYDDEHLESDKEIDIDTDFIWRVHTDGGRERPLWQKTTTFDAF